jgi:hypothetical protein
LNDNVSLKKSSKIFLNSNGNGSTNYQNH